MDNNKNILKTKVISAKTPQNKKDLKDVLLTSCKVGAEIMLGSEDPFQSMINVLGKSCIGTSLSKLSCSQATSCWYNGFGGYYIGSSGADFLFILGK